MSSAESKRLILQLPTVKSTSTQLFLSILFLQIDYGRSCDSTHPCQSPSSTVCGCDLTRPTWTQTPEQGYSDLTLSSRWSSTLTTSALSNVFPEGPVVCFLALDKTCVDVFGILPRFSKIYWRVKIRLLVSRPAQIRLSKFCGIFFQSIRNSLLERDAPVVSARKEMPQ